ncbi:MAG TPA: hypothetical protein V6D21_21860 [Candidatus Obscuribacterales bacterium]
MNGFKQNCLDGEQIGEDFIINNIEMIDVIDPEFCKFKYLKFRLDNSTVWLDVYGFKVGNWGLIPDGNEWQLYHITEGKLISFLEFTLANGLKGLKILVALFGDDFTMPPMGTEAYAKAYRQAYKFERYCMDELCTRSCLYFDDDDED